MPIDRLELAAKKMLQFTVGLEGWEHAWDELEPDMKIHYLELAETAFKVFLSPGHNSRSYTFRDDDYIVQYMGVVSDRQLAADLGRPEASVKKRAAKLKKIGAWEQIELIRKAQRDYLACLGHDEFDQTLATLAR